MKGIKIKALRACTCSKHDKQFEGTICCRCQGSGWEPFYLDVEDVMDQIAHKVIEKLPASMKYIIGTDPYKTEEKPSEEIKRPVLDLEDHTFIDRISKIQNGMYPDLAKATEALKDRMERHYQEVIYISKEEKEARLKRCGFKDFSILGGLDENIYIASIPSIIPGVMDLRVIYHKEKKEIQEASEFITEQEEKMTARLGEYLGTGYSGPPIGWKPEEYIYIKGDIESMRRIVKDYSSKNNIQISNLQEKGVNVVDIEKANWRMMKLGIDQVYVSLYQGIFDLPEGQYFFNASEQMNDIGKMLGIFYWGVQGKTNEEKAKEIMGKPIACEIGDNGPENIRHIDTEDVRKKKGKPVSMLSYKGFLQYLKERNIHKLSDYKIKRMSSPIKEKLPSIPKDFYRKGWKDMVTEAHKEEEKKTTRKTDKDLCKACGQTYAAHLTYSDHEFIPID